MNDKYNSTQYLLSLLRKGEIELVIENLIQVSNEQINDENFHVHVSTISAQYNRDKKDRDRSFITDEVYHIQCNKNIVALSDLIFKHQDYFLQDHIIQPPSYTDFQEVLDEIAYELALNYYHVSFGETNKDINSKKIFSDKGNELFIKNNEKKRNILIVGAGATYSSCPYIPFGKQLRMFLEAENPIYAEKMKRYGLQSSKRNSPFDPEDYLAELSNKLVHPERIKLREQIHNIYNKKFLPTHNYEFIAHLLKHQFIDIIINLNFDELLDEAIAEEFGKSQYIKVLDESDCESLDNILIDGRLKTPLYIKIHGTASAKNTLKFTKDHHRFEFPEEIGEFLKKWIRGNMKENCQEEDCRIPTNIFCLGFDIERAEFYNFLIDNLKTGSKFFLINWNKNIEAENFEIADYYYYTNLAGEKRARHVKLETWSTIEYEGKNDYIPSMANFFYCLWDKHLLRLFDGTYAPRSLARHEIVCDVFYNAFEHGTAQNYKDNLDRIHKKNAELTDYFRSTKYYFERTLLEVAITIVKNKGIIEPREAIKDERIGRFYGLYKRKFLEDFECASDRKQKIENFLNTDIQYCTELFSLNNIYKQCFKMEERYSFSNNLLNLSRFSFDVDNWDSDADYLFLKNLNCNVDIQRGSVENFLNKPENEHILVLFRIYKYIPIKEGVVFSHLLRKCNKDKKFKNKFLQRLCSNFNSIRKGFTYDITPKFLDEGLYYFESVKRKNILHTNLSLTYHFSNTLNSVADWNTLLIISERGKFIANHFGIVNEKENGNDVKRILKNKQIIIVACHEAVAEYLNQSSLSTPDLAKIYIEKNNLADSNVSVHFLPYWRHHHHMAIFLKIGNRDRFPVNRARFTIDSDISAVVVKSIYYFKQGFSNKINPFVLDTESKDKATLKSIQNDQELLLDTFLAHYIKAIVYEQNNNFIPVINPDLSFEAKIDGHQYKMNKEIFFKRLKDNLNKQII